MKTRDQIKKENITIISAMLKNDEICSGGIDEDLERHCMQKYNRTQEEITNLILIAHAIAFNQEIKLV